MYGKYSFELVFLLLLLGLTERSFVSSSSSSRSWEETCSRVECSNAFLYCNLMNKLGLNECKQCVSFYSPYCAQCARDLFDTDVYKLNDADTNEKFCKTSERMHQEGCKLVCRANGRAVGQCMENGGEPLCKCAPVP
jgi:hypothetical protein